MELAKRVRVLGRRDVRGRFGLVVGPQRDRERVVDIDPRFHAGLERRHRAAGLDELSSDLELELRAAAMTERCDASENAARSYMNGHTVRVVDRDRVVDWKAERR